MNTAKYILFVYGTLKKNERAHDLLGNPKYLGKGIIKGYKKIDMVYYPGGYLFKCVDVDIYVNQEVLKGIVYEYILQNEK